MMRNVSKRNAHVPSKWWAIWGVDGAELQDTARADLLQSEYYFAIGHAEKRPARQFYSSTTDSPGAGFLLGLTRRASLDGLFLVADDCDALV